MSTDTATLLVSIAALVVSLWAALKAYDASSHQARLQERIVSLESARERDRIKAATSAQLRATIEGDTSMHRIAVTNHGASHARAINIQLNGVPLMQHDLVPEGQSPITELGPGGTARCLVAIAMGAPDSLPIVITWEDDSGQPGSWRSQLTLL